MPAETSAISIAFELAGDTKGTVATSLAAALLYVLGHGEKQDMYTAGQQAATFEAAQYIVDQAQDVPEQVPNS